MLRAVFHSRQISVKLITDNNFKIKNNHKYKHNQLIVNIIVDILK